MSNIPHLLLAAGNSERMTEPKQLLCWGDKTLIEHQIITCLKTGQKVVVILGANATKIMPIIINLPISVFVNSDWKDGMGTSISFGIKMLNKNFQKLDGVLISLIDQPLVTAEHLNSMLYYFQPKKQQIIVSKSANGWQGVPVLFDECYFEILQKLKGDEGAKKILKQEKNVLKFVDGGDLLADIDTLDAYSKMFKKTFFK